VAVAAEPVAAQPVCQQCGGWTDDGGYMTWKKVVGDDGQPQLQCVKAFD
jgi:hypothetical protein